MDDLKAALHYALQPHHKHDFLYDCLDFSPCRLAHECMMTEIKPSHGRQWNIHPETGRTRRICEALLLLLLFGLTACLSIRLTDCLWPLFFETKTILWAWAEWLGLPAWLSAPIIHAHFAPCHAPTRDASAAFSAVPSVGIVGKKRLFSLGRIPVRPDNGVFLLKNPVIPSDATSHTAYFPPYSPVPRTTPFPSLTGQRRRLSPPAFSYGSLAAWHMWDRQQILPPSCPQAWTAGACWKPSYVFLIIRPVSLVWTAPY
mgnify:CR=1 FL=1